MPDELAGAVLLVGAGEGGETASGVGGTGVAGSGGGVGGTGQAAAQFSSSSSSGAPKSQPSGSSSDDHTIVRGTPRDGLEPKMPVEEYTFHTRT